MAALLPSSLLSLTFLFALLFSPSLGDVWVRGPNTTNPMGEYENSPLNPSGRSHAASWVDDNGEFWIYGGQGWGLPVEGGASTTGGDTTGESTTGSPGETYGAPASGFLSDLWKYNSSYGYVLVSGNFVINRPAVHGGSSDTPGGRYMATSWFYNGKLWLFGGESSDGIMDDVWAYTPGVGWERKSGTGPSVDTNYAATPYALGSRRGAAVWTTGQNFVYIFAGEGPMSSVVGRFDDVWQFSMDAGNWSFIGGSLLQNAQASYTNNWIGAVSGATTWTSPEGEFFYFGGRGYAATSLLGYLNDLWKFDSSTGEFTFITGSQSKDDIGNSSLPGSRSFATSWVANGVLWMFGGGGPGDGKNADICRYDLDSEEFSIVREGWLSGSAPNFAGGSVGARLGNSLFVAKNGALFVFGGQNGNSVYADLWQLVGFCGDSVVGGGEVCDGGLACCSSTCDWSTTGGCDALFLLKADHVTATDGEFVDWQESHGRALFTAPSPASMTTINGQNAVHINSISCFAGTGVLMSNNWTLVMVATPSSISTSYLTAGNGNGGRPAVLSGYNGHPVGFFYAGVIFDLNITGNDVFTLVVSVDPLSGILVNENGGTFFIPQTASPGEETWLLQRIGCSMIANPAEFDLVELRIYDRFLEQSESMALSAALAVAVGRDLCRPDTSPCHPNANCTDIGDSVNCTCGDGFIGDGYNNCTRECLPGFIGEDCDTCELVGPGFPSYPDCYYCAEAGDCTHGTCNSTGMCECNPNYYGYNCAHFCYAATSCTGQGTCSPIDGSCDCNFFTEEYNCGQCSSPHCVWPNCNCPCVNVTCAPYANCSVDGSEITCECPSELVGNATTGCYYPTKYVIYSNGDLSVIDQTTAADFSANDTTYSWNGTSSYRFHVNSYQSLNFKFPSAVKWSLYSAFTFYVRTANTTMNNALSVNIFGSWRPLREMWFNVTDSWTYHSFNTEIDYVASTGGFDVHIVDTIVFQVQDEADLGNIWIDDIILYPYTGCIAEDTCNNHGTCLDSGGCQCEPLLAGPYCATCLPGYDGYPNCADINECNLGTDGCDVQTTCENTVGGYTCSACPSGFNGTGLTGCEVCPTGFMGVDCSECSPDYYAYPDCNYCSNSSCQYGGNCSTTTGFCECPPKYSPPYCEQCAQDLRLSPPDCQYMTIYQDGSFANAHIDNASTTATLVYADNANSYSGTYSLKMAIKNQEKFTLVMDQNFYTNVYTVLTFFVKGSANIPNFKFKVSVINVKSDILMAQMFPNNVNTNWGPQVYELGGAETFPVAKLVFEATDGGNFGFIWIDSIKIHTVLGCDPAITCNNHGTCNNGTCACAAGFSGPNCDSCTISDDYFPTYPNCFYCESNGDCGQGVCDDGYCQCEEGKAGFNCSGVCDECNNHGSCDMYSGHCTCSGSFAGPNCEQCIYPPTLFSYPECFLIIPLYTNGVVLNSYDVTSPLVDYNLQSTEYVYNNGTYSMQFEVADQGGIQFILNQPLYIGDDYTFNFVLRMTDELALYSLYINFYSGNGTSIWGSLDINTVVPANEWKEYSISINQISGAVYDAISFQTDATYSIGTVWIDNVFIAPATGCTPEETCSGFGQCDAVGRCVCDSSRAGSNCSQCAPDHYGPPDCVYCTSEANCQSQGNCTSSGECECFEQYSGSDCDVCALSEILVTPNCTEGFVLSDGVFYGVGVTTTSSNYMQQDPTYHYEGSYSYRFGLQFAQSLRLLFNSPISSSDFHMLTMFLNGGPDIIYADNLTITLLDAVDNALTTLPLIQNIPSNTWTPFEFGLFNLPTNTTIGGILIQSTTSENSGKSVWIDNIMLHVEKDCTLDCNGHGICSYAVPGSCQCSVGFEGQFCNSCGPNRYGPTCIYCVNEQCGGHGVCGGDGGCACFAGFDGPTCQECSYPPDGVRPNYPSCFYCLSNSSCSYQGHCDNILLGECECDEGYKGYACEQSCTRAMNCSGRGECLSKSVNCQCDTGFVAPDCSQCAYPVSVFAYPDCRNGLELFYTNGSLYNLAENSSTSPSVNLQDPSYPFKGGYSISLRVQNREVFAFTLPYSQYRTDYFGFLVFYINGGANFVNASKLMVSIYTTDPPEQTNTALATVPLTHSALPNQWTLISIPLIAFDPTSTIYFNRIAIGAVDLDDSGTIYIDNIFFAPPNACDTNTSCNAHGPCLFDGTCQCDERYTLNDCSQCNTGYNSYPSCLPDTTCDPMVTCSGHGNCTVNDTCECHEGYSGFDCSADCVAATTCHGHGVCSLSSPGTCECNTGFAGPNCSDCTTDYWNYPNCIFCSSAANCTSSGVCNSNLTCTCNPGIAGANCSECEPGRVNFPTCVWACTQIGYCNFHGSCGSNGSCICDEHYGGEFCEGCAPDRAGYPVCDYCEPSVNCSSHGTCGLPRVRNAPKESHGKRIAPGPTFAPGTSLCHCEDGYTGSDCSQCSTDYYGYPNCVFCVSSSTCAGMGDCNNITGACDCDPGIGGANCSVCAPNHYDYPTCIYCERSVSCAGLGDCGSDGACECDTGFAGPACGECASGYFNHPSCVYCNESITCSGYGACNSSGLCECTGNTAGANCAQCIPNYYTYPNCSTVCNSDNSTCSFHGRCNGAGACECDTGFAGPACSYCAADHHGYPSCTYCNYNTTCSAHGNCQANGTCACETGFTGPSCSECAPDHHDYPYCTFCTDFETCAGHGTCQSNGSCQCYDGFKADVNCSSCAAGPYHHYPLCKYCTPEETCSGRGNCTEMGDCECQQGFGGPNCSSCAAHYFNYPTCSYCDNTVTCLDHGFCNGSGVCQCEPNYTGDRCNSCSAGHYDFPDCISCTSNGTCHGHGYCDAGGGCVCDVGFSGDCSSCASPNYFQYPDCVYCDNSAKCSGHGECTSSGTCQCYPGYEGDNCTTCSFNYVGYPSCTYCNPTYTCSNHGVCQSNGTCGCNTGYVGGNCSSCAPDYTNYPECIYCKAEDTCSNHGSCSANGTCVCDPEYNGPSCSSCGPNRFNFPTCTYCMDNETCSGQGHCNINGTCDCNSGIAGANCNACGPNRLLYPSCVYCTRNETCSGKGDCSINGSCGCDAGASGPDCSGCGPDRFHYPDCLYCRAEETCSNQGHCNSSGVCECNGAIAGPNCTSCSPDHYNYPSCSYCKAQGTCKGHGNCSETGGCQCNVGYDGADCSTCASMYSGYPTCTLCTREGTCSGHGGCTTFGTCNCDAGFNGANCSECATDHYNYPTCAFCEGTSSCSSHGTCNTTNAQCDCFPGFAGANCGQCADYYYGFPSCTMCSREATCSGHGICLTSGSCTCDSGFTGGNCSQCAPDFFNYPNCARCTNKDTCSGYGNCNGTGQCECNPGYTGANCGRCADFYFGFPSCTLCSREATCNGHGTCGASGNCSCDTGFVGGNCTACAPNRYNYPSCTYCDNSTCSGYGSCNSTSGLCDCQTGYFGDNCAKCASDYWLFPTCKYCNRNTTCGGHGGCTVNGDCMCDSGYVGPNCTASGCPPFTYGSTCANCTCVHGTCNEGRSGNGACSCTGNWLGTNCNLQPAPALKNATFSSTVVSIILAFDSPTNLGNQSLYQPFPCALVLTSSTLSLLGTSPQCSWLDSSRLSASLPSDASILPQNIVGIRENTIFAAVGSPTAASGQVGLLTPTDRALPSLTLNGPTIVSSCDGITLTATLQNSFGRPTTNTWSVNSTSPNIGNLQAALNSYTRLTPLVVDPALLEAGATYTFSVMVRNMFGDTASASYTVVRSQFEIPTISISGPTTIPLLAAQELSLKGGVVVSACKPSGDLLYSWTVTRSGGSTVTLQNSNRLTLIIPPYTLAAGQTYTARLTGAFSSNASLSNAASVTINVTRSDLVARIVGGSARSVSIARNLNLNASQSSDPDSLSTPLTFAWSCTPQNGTSCMGANGDGLNLPSQSTISYPAYSLVAGSTYIFTVVVSAADGRTATTFATITVLPGTPPAVSIAELPRTQVASSSRLDLKGTANPTNNISYFWTETSVGLDLSNRNNLLTQRTNAELAIRPNVLIPGQKYTFVLSATNANGSASASIDVRVSALPYGGTCGPNVPEGEALATSFTLACAGWQDDTGLGLLYSFSYQLGTSTVLLAALQLNPSVTTSLPLPPAGSNNVSIIVTITNTFQASTTTSFTVNVTKSQNGTLNAATQAFSQVLQNFNQYGDLDSSLQSMVVLASTLQSDSNTTESDNEQAVVLQAQIFSLFSSVVTEINDGSGEQQANTAAILSGSSSQWNSTTKQQLVNVVASITDSSQDPSNGVVQSLFQTLSNLFPSNFSNSPASTRTKRQVGGENNANNSQYLESVRNATNTLSAIALKNMLCGEDNTEISAANFQIVSGRVPPKDLANSSLEVSGVRAALPFTEDSFANVSCLDTQLVLQPIGLFSDSSKDFVSQIMTVTVSDGDKELQVKNLGDPVVLVFPRYDLTTSCDPTNITANCTTSCRYLYKPNNTWITDGCEVAAMNQTHVTCACNHLTDFAVQYRESTKPLTGVADAINDAGSSFPFLRKRPAPVIFICLIWFFYLLAMALVLKYDGAKDEELIKNSPHGGFRAKFSKRMSRVIAAATPPQKRRSTAIVSSEEIDNSDESKWQQLKRSISLRLKENHRWFRVFFRQRGDSFSRARRLTILLCVILTCLACNAIFYEAKHKPTDVPYGERVLIAFWSSLLVVPINLAIFMMFSKSGHRHQPKEIELSNVGSPPPPLLPPLSLDGPSSSSSAPPPAGLSATLSSSASISPSATLSSSSSLPPSSPTTPSSLILPEESYPTPSSPSIPTTPTSVAVAVPPSSSAEPEPEVVLGRFARMKAAFSGIWPWYYAYVAYVLAFLVAFFATFLALLYAARFNDTSLNGWLLSSCLSILCDIFINQPVSSVAGAIMGTFFGGITQKIVGAIANLMQNLIGQR